MTVRYEASSTTLPSSSPPQIPRQLPSITARLPRKSRPWRQHLPPTIPARDRGSYTWSKPTGLQRNIWSNRRNNASNRPTITTTVSIIIARKLKPPPSTLLTPAHILRIHRSAHIPRNMHMHRKMTTTSCRNNSRNNS